MKFISINYQDLNINVEIHKVHKVQCNTRAFFGLRGRNVGQTDGEAGTDAVINTFFLCISIGHRPGALKGIRNYALIQFITQLYSRSFFYEKVFNAQKSRTFS